MPRKPLKPCKHPGCPNLTEHDYCDAHAPLHRSDRASAGKRGYTSRWQKASKAYLRKHPLCAACLKEGRITKAAVVDHIVPHRGNRQLFWDESNWQPLCKHCHDVKTMTEEGQKQYKYINCKG
jgi:5-methylcytosine-specific restriction protein A